MSDLLKLSDLNLANPADPRILDRRLGEALGYRDVRKIKALIRRHAASLQRFGEFRTTAVLNSGRGRPSRAYLLNRKQALFIVTKSETDIASELTIEIIDVFDAVLSRRQPAALVPRQVTRNDNRIRYAKLRLADAVWTLDSLGVDVTAIDMRVVRDFARQIAA